MPELGAHTYVLHWVWLLVVFTCCIQNDYPYLCLDTVAHAISFALYIDVQKIHDIHCRFIKVDLREIYTAWYDRL